MGIKRNLEPKINKLLEQFPVVAVLGVRQCGKTTIAKQIRPDWKYFDLENPKDYDRIVNDPLFFFEQNGDQLIIDEAQKYPELFSVLRGIIDKQRDRKNRFILTGSSNPELLNHITESLAGRIAITELGTFKANEYYQKPLSDFYNLFSQKLVGDKVVTGLAPISMQEMQQVWLKGGYPEPTLQHDNDFYNQWMENYRQTYINRDISSLFPHLNKLAYRRFLMMLAKLSGTILNKNDIARNIEVNEKTVREYLTIADGTFIWRQLPSFEKNIIKAIVKMPKGYMRDSGLLHNFLNINNSDELYNDPIVGHSFESFVIEELLKGLQATMLTNWQAYYYRTRSGAEIDLILDGSFGILPIEIKYGSTVKMRALTSLNNFIEEHNLPLGMVINQSTEVEWLQSKIVQIPVGWL